MVGPALEGWAISLDGRILYLSFNCSALRWLDSASAEQAWIDSTPLPPVRRMGCVGTVAPDVLCVTS